MKQLNNRYLLAALAILSVLASCRKDDNGEDDKPTAERKGLYVLAEGGFNQNNSTLSYYDYGTKELVADQFSKANSRGLGDTGNDIQVYGSKMYVVVNVSSTVEVLNARTAVSVKKIEMRDGTKARQPRYIVFNKNKAYISSYDGTVAVLDTASLTIEKFITVGRNPEKMAIANNKLYVANSGGLDYPNYDKTVSVIDLSSNTEVKKITVVDNPRNVFADKYGDIYVMSSGNYGNVKASMAIINSQTDVIKAQADFSGGSVALNGDYAYITGSGGVVRVFNVKNDPLTNGAYVLEKDNFITDGTKPTTNYGIAFDEISGEVFVMDAKNYSSSGEVTCFDKDGKKKYSLTVGIMPNGVAFINK